MGGEESRVVAGKGERWVDDSRRRGGFLNHIHALQHRCIVGHCSHQWFMERCIVLQQGGCKQYLQCTRRLGRNWVWDIAVGVGKRERETRYRPSGKILLLLFAERWLAPVYESLHSTSKVAMVVKCISSLCPSDQVDVMRRWLPYIQTWRVKRSADWPTTLSYLRPSAASPAIATTASLHNIMLHINNAIMRLCFWLQTKE